MWEVDDKQNAFKTNVSDFNSFFIEISQVSSTQYATAFEMEVRDHNLLTSNAWMRNQWRLSAQCTIQPKRQHMTLILGELLNHIKRLYSKMVERYAI